MCEERLFRLEHLSESERSAVRAATRDVVRRARKVASTSAQVKVLHDWLIGRCAYDNEDPRYAYTAYGAVVKGKAVCAGIAEAFGYLCCEVGVACLRVVGYVNPEPGQRASHAGDGNHAWNMVQIAGQWYHIDVTHDLNASDQTIRYDNFLLSDEEMSTDRDFHRLSYPRCARSYRYYERAGAYAATSSALERMITARVHKGGLLVFQTPVFADCDEQAFSDHVSNMVFKAARERGVDVALLTSWHNYSRGVHQLMVS